MSPWIFWAIAAVLFFAAISLLYWGLWGDRSKGRLRCPKCWYDMSGSFEAGKLECPECGKDAGVEKRLRKNHCRWWAIFPSCVVLLPYFLVSPYAFHVWYGWHQEQEATTWIRHSGGFVDYERIPTSQFEILPNSLWPFYARITDVVLSGTDVTDSELVHLKDLTQLEHLYLNNTQVTDAGVAELQRALPNCKIEH